MKALSPTLMTLLESFFREYLQHIRGVSPYTIRAYRDTVRLFLEFVSHQTRRTVDRLELSDVTAPWVSDFLRHIESQRNNQGATRNCRLAALRCMVKHFLRSDPSRAEQYSSILALPAKRTQQRPPEYLEPEQFRLIMDQVDTRTHAGVRDGALLLLLYNTGARVSEALQLRWCDVRMERPWQVRLHGKGNKDRVCPLWKQSVDLLRRLHVQRLSSTEGHVFLNARGQALTRDGVAYVLHGYCRMAREANPSFPSFHVHPHTLRHSCAVALLQSGVALTMIRDYLGHSTIASTGRYLQTNMATKREVLNRFWKRAGLDPDMPKRWQPSQKLLTFLQSL